MEWIITLRLWHLFPSQALSLSKLSTPIFSLTLKQLHIIIRPMVFSARSKFSFFFHSLWVLVFHSKLINFCIFSYNTAKYTKNTFLLLLLLLFFNSRQHSVLGQTVALFVTLCYYSQIHTDSFLFHTTPLHEAKQMLHLVSLSDGGYWQTVMVCQ